MTKELDLVITRDLDIAPRKAAKYYKITLPF